MSALVVYYSSADEARQPAEAIARELHADSEMIRDAHTAEGVMGFDKNVLWNKPSESETQIGEPVHDPARYDLVVIGTALERGEIPAAVETFLKAYRDRLPDVAFFGIEQGEFNDNVFRRMEELCGRRPLAVEKLKAGLEEPGSEQRVHNFAQSLSRH